jgi:hypothetical protein
MSLRRKQTRVKIEIVVQGGDECAADYCKRLQKMIDEIQDSKETTHPPILIPTSASSGRMTTMIQWQEYKYKKSAKTGVRKTM